MSVLSHLEPRRVFYYFEQLCAIPHGSGNTKAISDYCADFARQRDLRCVQDESNNIIIFKPGTPGYEHSPAVMVQGHLDMVCEKEPGLDFDFNTDGLRLKVEDDVVFADGTTLGGDDGIAVAYALALLDAEDIPHPPLEAVFTADEEIGLLGAAALDCSPLQSRIMLNLDSEEEGCLLVSCAGGATATCRLPVKRSPLMGTGATLSVSGLLGGHSGTEIDKNRANANMVLGRLLHELGDELDYHLVSVDGGGKDNAIPRSAQAKIVIDGAKAEALRNFAQRWQKILGAEYAVADPDITVCVAFGSEKCFAAMTGADRDRVVSALMLLPNGIQRMSSNMKGLVQTSLNLGILTTSEEEVTAGFSVRSSVGSEKTALLHKLSALMGVLHGTMDVQGDYPAWEYRQESPLRELMIQVFEEQYGHKPVVQSLHAGVECGLFSGKLPGLDCVSFGPDMQDIHTTAERLSASSVKRTWAYLLEVLRRLK